MVERHSGPPWEKPRAVCPAAAGHGLGGKPALEAPGSPFPPGTLIAQEVYRRGRKGAETQAGHWFLKEPEAPPPPSPAAVGGTFVAWASLARSCDFQDWG